MQRTLTKPLLLFALALTFSFPTLAATYTPDQIRSAIKQAGGPEKFASTIAANTAKLAGTRIDDQTELTGAAALGKTIVYYVRTFNHSKSDIKNLQKTKADIAGRNAPSVCTAPTATILINEYDVEYKYMVYSKSREYLFEYSYNKLTCISGHKW